MQLLQFAESVQHILVFGQFLCFLAEGLFRLQVLLEVQVTQIAVDLDHVVELLYQELIGIVQVAEILGRDRTDFAPAVLDFAEGRERGTHIFLILYQSFQVLDNLLFGGKVLLALFFLLAVILRTLFFIGKVKRLETFFNGHERIYLFRFFLRLGSRCNGGLRHLLIGRGLLYGSLHAGFGLFLGKFLVESRFDGFRFLGFL